MEDALILIVDDEETQAETLRQVLMLEGFRAVSCYSADAAVAAIAERTPDAVVSDYRMGERTGLDLFHEVHATHPEMLFILATAYGSLETAVSALKAGVHDFITKPVDTDELVIKLRKALNFKSISHENEELKKKLAGKNEPVIIGCSSAMRDALESAERVARSVATVLIQGESGTGKGLIARTIHARSAQADGPFIKVNCAAIPDNLLEDELFGHEQGAFTGATQTRQGKFEAADGGSIFLDEIGEMPTHLQTKFLRVLQEREFERVGDNQTRQVNVRVIAATNRDLAEMVRTGEFRQDLYYRLNVIPILIPPLRDRMEDVPLLSRHFLSKFCEQNGRELRDLSDDANNRLGEYSWPGNVRELENCIERAVVMMRGDAIHSDDIVFAGEARSGGVDVVLEELLETDLTLDALERRLIESALKRNGGNISQTARGLGLTRRTLQYRLEKIRDRDGEEEE